MLTFLGMINYCRQWIPECSHHDSILRQATKGDSPEHIQWTTDMTKSYIALKTSIISAPALGLPDYCKPFHLYARDNCKTMAAVCAQEHGGGNMRPVAFFSKVVPIPVQGMPACLRALAACAMAVEMVETITLGHPIVLHTSHQVLHLVKNVTTQHMTSQRLSGYECILLNNTNLTIKYSSVSSGPTQILSALLTGSPDFPTDHDCIEVIHHITTPRPDLMDKPFDHADNVFVDGSCSRPSDGIYKTGYVVVQLPDIVLDAGPIPYPSAQAAELIALTKACKLFENKSVNIYTDSRYAFGVVHDFGMIWKQRGFVSADGKTISHTDLIN
ncbi:uncharacterized protein LOC128666435 [Bombina bombina]|uniref:uncharacterized protein LOC128666435 n=1 Tax=Bombina bombina TaxID=8345 RepID=UPI00235AE20B|nr:uncharacterized protein LOC128666435 [Bombina bombina]